MATKYQECTIKPASGGFGEWDIDRGESYEDIEVLLSECRENLRNCRILELGTDDLPEGVDDIRGSIHNEPTHVYVAVGYAFAHEFPYYFGINEYEAEETD